MTVSLSSFSLLFLGMPSQVPSFFSPTTHQTTYWYNKLLQWGNLARRFKIISICLCICVCARACTCVCAYVSFLGIEWICIFYNPNWLVLNGVRIQEHDKENNSWSRGNKPHIEQEILHSYSSSQACKLSATLQNIGGTLDVAQIGGLFETGPSDLYQALEKLHPQSSFGGHTSLLSQLMAHEMASVWQHNWNSGYIIGLVCILWPQNHASTDFPLLILWRGTRCQMKI